MLDVYRVTRERRLKNESRSQQTAGALVIGGLQKRLLSCIEAFAKTLSVHRKSVERALEGTEAAPAISVALQADLERLTGGGELDIEAAGTADDREVGGEIDEPDDAEQSEPSELEFDDLMTTATAASTDSSRAETRTALLSELALVDEMLDVAEASRYDADPRVRKIIDWIEANMCRGLSAPGATPPQWSDRRLLIFTEYEDTRRWLQRCLSEAITHSDRASERIATFTGMTSRHRREDIKHAFNTEPGDHPLRGSDRRRWRTSAPLWRRRIVTAARRVGFRPHPPRSSSSRTGARVPRLRLGTLAASRVPRLAVVSRQPGLK